MACANAVGSNVFNIFLGIGLPMMLSEFAYGEPFIVPDGVAVLTSTCMLILITIAMVRAGGAPGIHSSC
jgi:Ca2+/Na+ antiporter